MYLYSLCGCRTVFLLQCIYFKGERGGAGRESGLFLKQSKQMQQIKILQSLVVGA